MTSRVLVVDDEPAIRHALGRLFRREGWEVVTAATAGEALAALETEPAHAVLLDYHLPGMSGADARGGNRGALARARGSARLRERRSEPDAPNRFPPRAGVRA